MHHPIATASPVEFMAEVRRLQFEAERVCRKTPDSDLEKWMAIDKAKGMTWVEGLEWVTSLRAERV